MKCESVNGFMCVCVSNKCYILGFVNASSAIENESDDENFLPISATNQSFCLPESEKNTEREYHEKNRIDRIDTDTK